MFFFFFFFFFFGGGGQRSSVLCASNFGKNKILSTHFSLIHLVPSGAACGLREPGQQLRFQVNLHQRSTILPYQTTYYKKF